MSGLNLSGCLFTLWALSISPCWAQGRAEHQNNQFCLTTLAYQPRPTFFSIKRYHSASYLMRQTDGTHEAIEENSNIEVSLRVPFVFRPGFRMVGSFTYYDEDFEFVQHKVEASLPQLLHEKPLRSFNTSFYIVTPFRGSLFLTNRLQASLNGDFYRSPRSNYLNYSFASIVGWRKSENTMLGLGVIYSVDFHGGSVIPLVAFQHVFTPQWSIEALLPARTSLQYYSANRKNVITGNIKLNSPAYNINLNFPSGVDNQYIFQRNEIRWSLNVHREIHDWLWMGAEAGVNTPLSSDWLKAGNPASKVFETPFRSNFFASLSMLMVVPQKLFDRKK